MAEDIRALPPLDVVRAPEGGEIGPVQSGWRLAFREFAANRLAVIGVGILVFFVIFLLLYVVFHSVTEAAVLIFPTFYAMTGGLLLQWLLGYNFSVAVWVGYIALFGIAVETGVVMVVYIDEAFHRRVREGRLTSREDIVAAHAEGTVQRLRPKIMTITTMAASLRPLLWAEGAGAEIMRRVAAPMLGGLLTSAFLTLEVLPVLYTIWRYRQLRRAEGLGLPIEAIVGPAASEPGTKSRAA